MATILRYKCTNCGNLRQYAWKECQGCSCQDTIEVLVFTDAQLTQEQVIEDAKRKIDRWNRAVSGQSPRPLHPWSKSKK
jgi:hypothetical protein